MISVVNPTAHRTEKIDFSDCLCHAVCEETRPPLCMTLPPIGNEMGPPLHSTGFQIWPLPMLFLNSLRNNIFWKNICEGFCSCKSQRNAKFDTLHWRKWVPDVSPLRNVKFRVPLTFTAAKVFVNIFSRKYYFTNNLEITLAGAKFWTLCCEKEGCAS